MKKSVEKPATQTQGRNYRVLISVVICGILLGSFITYLFFASGFRKAQGLGEQNQPASKDEPKINLLHENGKALTKPLLLVVVGEESAKYNSLKGKITATIHEWQNKGAVQSVSVYLKDLNDASWMSIDGDKAYMPGSLIKVPIMLYFLKQEEEHPGTLNKSIFFEKPKHYFPTQEYKGDSILPGKSYKISELLKYMIVESDNYSTNLLSRQLDADQFRKVFTELNIPPDEINDLNYAISPRDYSKFFRILYNATYLDQNLSEYGLNLLTQCKFKDGIVKKLPPGTVVAHKFGERGINEMMDFSESAIIYKDNNPYSLTIMTKGTTVGQQTDLVSEISEEVFHGLNDN